MLDASTHEKLTTLRLDAMAAAWQEQQRRTDHDALTFDERFGLLVDAQWLARENRRLQRALKEARLRLTQASLEAIDHRPARPLDKALLRQLATGRWISEHHNVIILTSQLPVEHWHDHLGEATVADAICDRLLHNAHRIALKGPSRRKENAQLDA